MSGCLFCDIYKEDKGTIEHEDKFFYLRFDRFPVSPGHMLIIAKRHILSSLNMTDEEVLSLYNMKKCAVDLIEIANLPSIYYLMAQNSVNESSKQFLDAALRYSTLHRRGPDGYNFGENLGEVAGRTIHHFHYHVIPRYFGDVNNPRGGVRNIIAGKGDY